MALTKAQAQIVLEAIGGTAHDTQIEFVGPNRYIVRGVDDKTGYPFTVAVFDDWQANRRIAEMFADDDEG